MFSVIFEVHPKPDQWDAYLDNAKRLRPELERVDGFVDGSTIATLKSLIAARDAHPQGSKRSGD